jgi:hypothetical protein
MFEKGSIFPARYAGMKEPKTDMVIEITIETRSSI